MVCSAVVELSSDNCTSSHSIAVGAISAGRLVVISILTEMSLGG